MYLIPLSLLFLNVHNIITLSSSFFCNSWAYDWTSQMGNEKKCYLKCIWHEIFYELTQKSFQNDEEWRLFYCDSTFGSRVIQDFGLRKLDD